MRPQARARNLTSTPGRRGTTPPAGVNAPPKEKARTAVPAAVHGGERPTHAHGDAQTHSATRWQKRMRAIGEVVGTVEVPGFTTRVGREIPSALGLKPPPLRSGPPPAVGVTDPPQTAATEHPEEGGRRLEPKWLYSLSLSLFL